MFKKNIFYLGFGSLLAMALSTRAIAQDQIAGILNQSAPSLEVTAWLNLPQGQTTLDIKDYKGKVVYLYCFQTW